MTILKMCRTALVVLLLTGSAFQPAHGAEGRNDHINPVYRDLVLILPFPGRRPLEAPGAPIECTSFDALQAAMKQQFELREGTFSIHLVYDFLFDEVEGLIQQARDGILAEDDYLRFSYTTMGTQWAGNDGDVTIDASASYLTTYDEEQQVSQRVAQILAEIVTDGMTDEHIEKAVHDWIVQHVAYDTNGTEYSAYGALFQGTAVCQGYALLAFKMLRDAGVGARIIDGLGDGVNHAWNMVYLCGQWYHLDVTWDDPVPDGQTPIRYTYFNLSDVEMGADHSWEQGAYPEAVLTYVEGVCDDCMTVTGFVVTLLPGYEAGIMGALVSLSEGVYTATTARDGRFTLADVPRENGVLTAAAAGFQTFTQTVPSQLPHLDLGALTLSTSCPTVDQAVQAERARYDPSLDGKVGLEEAIHALQVVSGMKEAP